MIKGNENHYPSDDAEIVADDTSIPARAKLAYSFVMLASLVGLLGPQICTKEKKVT
jgi:hypothetical protein